MEQTRKKNKAPTIEPRKNADGSDYYRIRLQVNGKREQFTFRTLEEAEAKVRELMAEKKNPIASNAYLRERRESEGFGVVFKKWLEDGKATKRLKGSTCYSHTSIYHLLEPIQKLALSEITKEKLTAMFNSEEWSKLSAATFKHLVSIINNTNQFASENLEVEKTIKFNVAKFSKPFRPLERSKEEVVRWLTKEELQLVVSTAYRGAQYEFNGVPKGRTNGKNKANKRELWLPRWVAPSIILAANTGLRIGELLGLTWAKVDMKKREIYVHNTIVQDENGKHFFAENRTKTVTSRRTISLSDNAIEALKQLKTVGKEYEEKFGEPSPFVLTKTFKTPRQKNKWLSPVVFRNTLDRLFNYLEISGMGPHKLRHTFATIFLSESQGNFDNNARVLQDLLGHATIEMSMFYAHVSLGKKANAVKVFDEVSGALTSKLEDKKHSKPKKFI
jgi:integrase